MHRIKQKHIFLTLAAVCAASLIFSIYSIGHHIIVKNKIVMATKVKFKAETDRIVSEIDAELSVTAGAASAAARSFSEGKINEKELAKELSRIAADDKKVIKFLLMFPPARDTESAEGGGQSAQRQVAYYECAGGKARQVQPPEGSGPEQEAWCTRDMSAGEGWDEPIFDEDAKYYTVAFSAPLYDPRAPGERQKEAAGAVYVDFTLSWLKDKMDSINLEKNDVGLLLSGKGTILYHPISELAYKRTNIFEILERRKEQNKNYERQKQIVEKAINGESGGGLNISRTGEAFWFFYKPVPSTGWALVLNFTKDAVAVNGKTLRRQQVRIALGLMIFLTTLTALLLGLYRAGLHKTRKLWQMAVVFSLLCFGVSCYTWYLALSIPLSEYQQNKTVIDDQVSLNRFKESAVKLARDMSGVEPVFIPTGINIQSMDFSTSNDIAVSGYIWQRYSKPDQDGLPRGFVLPEAKQVSVTEAYRRSDPKEEVIGWYFEAVVRQTFDYAKYPFDHPNISIWIRPSDFVDNIILVPDLKGYRATSANYTPGMQVRLALPGYALGGTFFSMEPRMFNANFGIAANKQEMRDSELFYNAVITRNFMTPLIAKFFPVFIVVSMLFIVTLSFSTDAVKQKNFGLSGLAIFGLIVSFFFTTLLSQVDLRTQLKADNIIFIENFNFITYMVLLLSAIQAFLFASEKKIWFIQYEHCLIPKLLYWPIFTLLVLSISLVYFF